LLLLFNSLLILIISATATSSLEKRSEVKSYIGLGKLQAMTEPGAGGDRRATMKSPLVILAIVLGLFTLSDINGNTGSGASASSPSGGLPKEVPTPKYASMLAGPTIKFLYWCVNFIDFYLSRTFRVSELMNPT
jgi:hypothetical protein